MYFAYLISEVVGWIHEITNTIKTRQLMMRLRQRISRRIQVLNDYVDACELVRETEDDIAELEQKQSVVTSDKVKGSMNEHPYTQQSFNIEGLAYDEKRNERLTKERDILSKRREKANSVRLQALEVINQAPIRIQRIIRFRYEKKLTWEEVADRMKGSTSGGLKMELKRFFEEK